MQCFECSAKADIGVEKAFLSIATEVKARLTADNGGARPSTQTLTPGGKPAGGGGCC